jgi:hypothetical protein
LIQISVAKNLRDNTDRAAQQANESEVNADRLMDTARSMGLWSDVRVDASTNLDKTEKNQEKAQGVSA